MKCIILAAGYATRLYPLTENFPKPLLKVGGKTILDWMIGDIEQTGVVDEYIVVSNHKFAHFFDEWASDKSVRITVVDDGTSTNETRLGAVCDIQFAVDTLGLDDDLLVIAGDNLLDFSLQGFIRYSLEKKASCIMRFNEPDEKRLHKCGVVCIDSSDRVIDMEEKPDEPKSSWISPPFYYYTRSDAAMLKKAIESGCGVDAPGSFVAWLSKEKPVYAMEMPGNRFDIGNIQSYEFVKATYKGIVR